MEAGTWVTDTDACEVHWFLNHTVGKADVWWLKEANILKYINEIMKYSPLTNSHESSWNMPVVKAINYTSRHSTGDISMNFRLKECFLQSLISN